MEIFIRRKGGFMIKKLDWKIIFTIAAAAVGVYLCIHYWPNISDLAGAILKAATPLIFGFVVAYPLNILLCFYERHFFPKSNKNAVIKARLPVCLVGAIITVLGIITLVAVLITPQLVACVKMLIDQIPGAIEMLTDKLRNNEFVSRDLVNAIASFDWKTSLANITDKLTTGVTSVMDVAFSAISSVFSALYNIVLSIIFAIYILFEKRRLARHTNKVSKHYIPNRFLSRIRHIVAVLDDSFHKFIVGQCMEAVILGILCIIGMTILRIPYAPMIGTLMGFTALIPIVGGLIGAGVGAFLIFMESPVKALIFIIFVIILQQVEGNLIYPKVVGSSIGLPGLWVLAAVTIGGGVGGILGMLVAVPITATIYRLIREDVTEDDNKPADKQPETVPEQKSE